MYVCIFKNFLNICKLCQNDTFNETEGIWCFQVEFRILEAGGNGVSQSRERAFIWAAAPEKVLLEWPEPMHVFAVPKLKISVSRGLCNATVIRA